ncbi:MAG TPA: DUF2238 domain-containing protein [Pseudomonadales bacterium]|nr:DUF2238 domain-containing protein [Pseudomonadales bacterium]
MTTSYIDQRKPLLLTLLAVWLAAFVVSGIQPYDRLTWLMEVMPAILGVLLMIYTWRKFPLTTLLYVVILIHSLILMLGGHYTYARTPLGEWWKEWFGFQRNNYDRLGHIAQGFIPALITREILLRASPLQVGGWLNFLTVTVCMAISVAYEFIEWWAALLLGQGADEFLATQGDIWDTQWDMFLCTIGAISAVVLLSAWHNRMIDRLQKAI